MKIEGASVATDFNPIKTIVNKQQAEAAEVKVQPEVRKIVEQEASVNLSLSQKVDTDPAYVPNIAEKAWLDAVEEANRKLQGVNTEFRFSVHEATKAVSIKVLNKETGELIREIPPEKILDIISKLWEVAGIFVDERR